MLLSPCGCALQYYTQEEAKRAGDALKHTPEAATSAVGTAGEIVGGVTGHIVDKVGLLCNSLGLLFGCGVYWVQSRALLCVMVSFSND